MSLSVHTTWESSTPVSHRTGEVALAEAASAKQLALPAVAGLPAVAQEYGTINKEALEDKNRVVFQLRHGRSDVRLAGKRIKRAERKAEKAKNEAAKK